VVTKLGAGQSSWVQDTRKTNSRFGSDLRGKVIHQHGEWRGLSEFTEQVLLCRVLEVLIANGMEGMADAMTTLTNEAMKIERSHFLGAGRTQQNVWQFPWRWSICGPDRRRVVGCREIQICVIVAEG